MNIPRIHPDTIEAVKERVDIVDIIGEYVVLRKRGKDYVGLCPFHGEKTASFTVSPGKQLYYCFGCGAGGNSFKFLMELGKHSFADVVLSLAQRYQVPVKTLAPEQQAQFQKELSLREQLYEILAITTQFYQHGLRQPSGEMAWNYLKQDRQFSEVTIQRFQLGYAPGGWETLYHYLIEQKRYPVTLVEQAGLVQLRSSGKGYYDRFRNRLMIPIHDPQGRVIGFGSRTLTNEEPKYLNSPDTPLFDKGKTLFALDKAKDHLGSEDRAVLVEGYFDAIALHAAGIRTAIAALGTAFSQAQLKLLLRYDHSNQVVFNFDADAAGEKAAQRAIGEIESLIASGQVQLRILQLPAGKDADEFLKSSPDAVDQYRKLLQAAPLWFDWQIQQLLKNTDLKQADQFQAVSQKMAQLLGKIEAQNLRDHYVSYCAQLLSQEKNQYFKINTQDFKQIAQSLNSAISHKRRNPSSKSTTRSAVPTTDQPREKNRLEEAESLLLRLYLHCPSFRWEICQEIQEKDLIFNFSHHRQLWQTINEIQETIDPLKDPSNQLLSLLTDYFLSQPDRLSWVEPLFQLNEKTQEDLFRAQSQVQEAIRVIERTRMLNHRQYCKQRFLNLDLEKESDSFAYYQQEFLLIDQQIRAFDQENQ